MSFRSSIAPSLAIWLQLCLWPGVAWTHAYPNVVSPADGSLVAEMPQEVRIRFTEGVELEFSRIQVKDPSGKVVSQGTIRRLAADTLAVDLKAGGAGHYTIEWQVLSVDTHVTEGTLRFTVSGQGK